MIIIDPNLAVGVVCNEGVSEGSFEGVGGGREGELEEDGGGVVDEAEHEPDD